MLIDGIVLGDHTVVIALGIDTEGKKQVLGLREGHTEHSRVVKALLRDLVERGLDPERARLFVIDGAKALTSASTRLLARWAPSNGVSSISGATSWATSRIICTRT